MEFFGRFARSKSGKHADDDVAADDDGRTPDAEGDRDHGGDGSTTGGAGADVGADSKTDDSVPQQGDAEETTRNGAGGEQSATGGAACPVEVGPDARHGGATDSGGIDEGTGTIIAKPPDDTDSKGDHLAGGAGPGAAATGGLESGKAGADQSHDNDARVGQTLAGAVTGDVDDGHAPDADPSGPVAVNQLELDDILQRIKNVKDEYGASVKRLMDTKRDLNQKRLELESVEKQIAQVRESADVAAGIDAKTRKEIGEKKDELENIRGEIKEAQASYDALLEDISRERHALSATRTQHSEIERQLEDANARLYNAREELGKQDVFQDPSSLTRGEREFIEGGDASGAERMQHPAPDAGAAEGPKSYAGVVEAASVVVASLKSRLGMMQKELEAAQLMLDQERAQHDETRRQLEDALRGGSDSGS